MSEYEKQEDLASFEAVIRHVETEGIRATVIGGCAVGAYARMHGAVVLSGDLDLFVSEEDQKRLERDASRLPGVRIVRRPEPRGLPTLVLDWCGVEVDALTRSSGPLPPPDRAYAEAWRINVADISAHVLNPFALLENKLGVRREKDRPHIDILVDFLHGHVLAEFTRPDLTPRQRLQPAKRFLEVLGTDLLPWELFELMMRMDNDSSTRRFLVAAAPDEKLAESVISSAPSTEVGVLRHILSRRHVST